MDVKVALPGSPILSGHSGGNATITSTLSNFVSQLRIGDVVEFSNNGAAHKATVTAVTDNFNFNITRIGSTTLSNGALTSPIIRTRPEIKEANKKKLLTPLGFAAVMNTNNNNTQNPAGYYRISVKITVNGSAKHLQTQEQDYYGRMVLIMMTSKLLLHLDLVMVMYCHLEQDLI